jgi:hypothetical protein
MDIMFEIFVKSLKFSFCFFIHLKILFFPEVESTHVSTSNKICLYDANLGHHKLSYQTVAIPTELTWHPPLTNTYLLTELSPS